MSALYLILALLSSLTIVILLRFYEQKDYSRYVIIASNYIVSCSFGFLLLKEKSIPDPKILVLGFVVGFLFFFAFVLFSRGLIKEGIATTVTIGRLSLAIPVMASIIFWNEIPMVLDIVSLITIVFVIIFWEDKITKISPLLILLFFLFGTIDSSMKFFKIKFPFADINSFLIIIFFSALIWSWLYILIKKEPVRKKYIFKGLLLGIPNYFSSFFILKALSSGVPAFITFPFVNIGVIILSAISGRIIFNETLSIKKYFLMLLGIGAIIILTT